MITFLNDYFSGACRRYKKFMRNSQSGLRFAPHLLMLAGAAFSGHSHALSCSASADSWGSGYVLNVTVTNDSSASISSWQVNLNHNANPGITGSWNANVSSSGNQVEASNVSWNGSLSPGQSTSFGYQGTHSGNFQLPECIGDGGSPTPTPTNAPTPTPSVTPTSINPTPPPTPTPEPTATPEPGANLVIQENDNGFCEVEGSIDSNNSGFTGGGFANTDNASGRGIEWSLEANTSGNYDLQWRFANGSSSNRYASVIIDGTEQASVDFEGTGSWVSWRDSAAVTVYLSAGVHTLRLNANTSGGLANIDKITVIGGDIKAGNCSGAPTPPPTTPASPTPTPEPTPTNVPTPTHEPGKALPLHFHETRSWASNITAGLDGRVIKVTNLNRSGSGSLGAAIAASGKRLVVFEVGGVINLRGSRLSIGKGDLYVAGETAPYPGITIIRGQTNISGNNIVLSHLSFRLGDGDGGASDTISISGDNIVLNHVAASWSIDECVSMSGARNVTLYKTMVTEALSYSTHREGEHSKGSLIQRGTNNTALYHTLYAHNALRNPRLHSSAKVALINGVIYNWLPGNDDEGEKKFHFIVHMNDAAMSVVGNVALQGPDSVGDTLVSGHKRGSGDAYMRNNIIVDPFGNALKEYNTSNITPLSQPPLWPQGVVVQPADEAFYEVLRTVGPRPGDRDPINARVVATVANGTGKRVNSQNDVGGYPNYALTRHTVNVPNGLAARRAWLDSIEDSFAVDRSLDLSRLYSIVGSSNSDKLR